VKFLPAPNSKKQSFLVTVLATNRLEAIKQASEHVNSWDEYTERSGMIRAIVERETG